ncbi:unnamed protein product, partial [Rotaria sp. Silwood2]
MGVGNRSSKTT